MKNLKQTLFGLLALVIFLPNVVKAQILDAGTSTVGLDPIIIPFFPVFGTINAEYFTVLSWITFIAGILVILVIIFWILRILMAGLDAIRSEGDQEKLKTAFQKLQSNLVGMGITFLIPIILTVIGFVLGIGSIFNWPKMFSGCPNTEYEYYFRAYFNAPENENPTDFATGVCGLDSQN